MTVLTGHQNNIAKQLNQKQISVLHLISWFLWMLSTMFTYFASHKIVQELCESRGGRPGLSILTSLLVSVDIKLY